MKISVLLLILIALTKKIPDNNKHYDGAEAASA
jgi:hypothetical protein